MQKAYRNLVKYALDNGYTVSVFDGEEWSTVRSTRFNDIIKDIEGVEEAALNIRDEDGHRVGWALVSAFGLEPDETVVDYTTTPFMNAWEAHYSEDEENIEIDLDGGLSATNEQETDNE